LTMISEVGDREEGDKGEDKEVESSGDICQE
jgi:hypothetical protein